MNKLLTLAVALSISALACAQGAHRTENVYVGGGTGDTDGGTSLTSEGNAVLDGTLKVTGTLTTGTAPHILTNAAGLINGGKLQLGTVLATMLGNDSITATQLGPDSVEASELADDSVASANIIIDTIVHADIATGAVRSDEILDGTVALADMASVSVDSDNIVNETIVSADILNETITSADILDETIASADILNGTIAAGDIGANAVDGSELVDGSVDDTELDNTDDFTMNALAIGAGEFSTSGIVEMYVEGGEAFHVHGGFYAGMGDTVTSTGTTLVGVSTVWAGHKAGDVVKAAGQIRHFVTITDNTHATVDIAPSPAWSGDNVSSGSLNAEFLASGSTTILGTITAGTAPTVLTDSAGLLVGGATITAGSITTTQVGTDTLLAGDIATGAVATAEILDETIAAADIAPDAIAASELADNSVASANIIVDTILAADIAAGAVGTSELAASAVTTTEILVDTILAGDIATSAVTTAEILDETIAVGDIGPNAVDGSELVDGSVDNTELDSTDEFTMGGVINTGMENYSSDGDPLIIASGVVTVTQTRHNIDGQVADTADALLTINGGTDGDTIRLQRTGGETITLEDDTGGGGGNLSLAADILLNSDDDVVELQYDGDDSKWFQVGIPGAGGGSFDQDDDYTFGGDDVFTNDLTLNADLLVNGAATFNEDGTDDDFRIEGDTEVNLFFVDASSETVGIKTNSPDADVGLHVLMGGTATTAGGTSYSAIFQNSNSAGTDSRISIMSGTTGNSTLAMGDTDNLDAGMIDYDNNTGALAFYTNDSTLALTLDSSQDATFAGTLASASLTTTGDIAVNGGDITGGVAGTGAGLLTLHGAPTSSNEGGEIKLKLADDHDTTIDNWTIDTNQDDLRIFPNTAAGIFHFRSDGDFEMDGDATFAGDVLISHSGTATLEVESSSASADLRLDGFTNMDGRIYFAENGTDKWRFHYDSSADAFKFREDVADINAATIADTSGEWTFNYDTHIGTNSLGARTLTLHSTSLVNQMIRFEDGNAANGGYIKYDGIGNDLRFGTRLGNTDTDSLEIARGTTDVTVLTDFVVEGEGDFEGVLRAEQLVVGSHDYIYVASGVLAPANKTYIRVRGESNNPDTVTSISAPTGGTGTIIILDQYSSGDDITFTDNDGSLNLSGDYVLTDDSDKLALIYDGSNWEELFASNNQ